MLVFKVVPFGGAEYDKSVQLRQLVLRTPLNLTFTKAELNSENNQFHLVALKNEKVFGVLILMPLENRVLKMRQVAVESSCCGKGIGKNLVLFAEEFAVEQGFKLMILHARKTAVGFYLKLNYKAVGEEFEEVGIPHLKMEKKLN